MVGANSVPFDIANCTFTNCKFGIYSIDQAINMYDCYFIDNETGWNAINTNQYSTVGTSLFDNNITAINMYLPANTAILNLKGTTIINNDNGVIVSSNATVQGTCNYVIDNDNDGFKLGAGSKIDFGGINSFGRNTITNNFIGLNLNEVAELDLDFGENDLKNYYRGVSGFINWQQICQLNYIKANKNHWNNGNVAPIWNSDYVLYNSCNQSSVPTSLIDNVPLTTMPECDGPLTPPNNGGGNYRTVSILGNTKSMIEFYNEARNIMGIDSLKNNVHAFKILYELQQLNYTDWSQTEIQLLNKSYLDLSKAYGYALSKKEISRNINANILSQEIYNKLISVQDQKQIQSLAMNDTANYFQALMTYATSGNSSLFEEVAQAQLGNLYGFSNNYGKLLVESYQCLIEEERKLRNNEINEDEFEINIDACINYANQRKEEYSSISAQENILTVFPNPTTDKIFVKYYLQESSPVTIQIEDLQGRLIKNLIVEQVYQAGNIMNSFDISELQKGIYLIKIFENKDITVKRVVKI
jgi:hypothetical protein